MEMLFEQDNEEKSVASLVLDALVKVTFVLVSFCSNSKAMRCCQNMWVLNS